ncbi:MAG TPA: hypothetical protein VK780_02895, partial [Thermoanaerobaculia bacterium]|nr:hypothetical protein [Thermoanaerobaculia bacterium]
MTLEHFINWMIFLVIPVVILIAGFAIALSRKPTALLTRRPSDLEAIGLAPSGGDLIARLKERARTSGLRVVAESPSCVIFADRPSVLSWGFFYPVYLNPQESGQIAIEVGIKSRLRQDASWNPIRSRKLSRFVEIARQAMAQPTKGQP